MPTTYVVRCYDAAGKLLHEVEFTMEDWGELGPVCRELTAFPGCVRIVVDIDMPPSSF